MSNYSFNIKTSKDLYRKLFEDYEIFLADCISSSKALNCAMTAWHLCEWTCEEFILLDSDRKDKKVIKKAHESHRNELIKNCPSLAIMRDLIDGTKHHTIDRPQKVIKQTDLHQGTFDNTFDWTFDTSRLVILQVDGREVYFLNEIKIAVNFWNRYFNQDVE